MGCDFKGSIINEFENLTFKGTIYVRYVSILAILQTLLANKKIVYKVPDVLHCLANVKKMFKVERNCKWSIFRNLFLDHFGLCSTIHYSQMIQA